MQCRQVFPPKLKHFRSTSFCQQTLQRPIPIIISPLDESELFREHPFVTGPPELKSYVGVPIVIDNCYVGALCMFWKTAPIKDDIRAYAPVEKTAQQVGEILKMHA